jgi:glutaredoxin 3
MLVMIRFIKTTIFFLAILFQSNCKESNTLKQVNKEEEVILFVYGSDTCHYCLDTKTYLNENKIKYIYYDIDKNQEKLNEMITKLRANKISLSNLSLPVIDKNGFIFNNSIEFEEFLIKILN